MKLVDIGIKKTVIEELSSVALFKPYLDLLKIAETIDAIVPKERNRDLTHGQVIETLVANRCPNASFAYSGMCGG